MILKRVKIGTRLLIGFGGVLATLATLAAIGLVSVTSIGGAVNHVVTLGDEATTAGMMRAAVNSEASLLKDLAMAGSPADVAGIERKLDDEANKYKKADAHLTELFAASGANDTQRGLYTDAKTRAEAGRSAAAELIALAHSADSAALKTRLPAAVAALQDWRSKLNDLVKVQSGLNDEAAASARHSVTASQIMVAVTAVIGLALGFLLSAIISGSITTPLRAALEVAENVAAGRLEAHVTVPDGADETAQLLRALARMNDSLRTTVGAVASGSTALAASARALNAQASASGEGAETQAREMESSAAAVEEMSQSIHTIADAADELRQASSGALFSAERSEETMQQLSGELGSVTHAVQEIHASVGQFVARTAEITGMTREVRELADQTNLLALNAAIEAARAGEMGRGFAVVADEVRKLAEHSAKAASRIDGVTRALEQQSGNAQAAVQRGLDALNSSGQCTGALSSLLQDSRAAMEKSHQGVEGIAVATREQLLASSAIASSTEHASVAADRQRAASAEVKDSAGQLLKLAADLQTGIAHFRA